MKLTIKNLKFLIKENEEAANKKPLSSGYKFEFKGEPYSLKIIQEQDDEGKTYFWPIPVRKQGEGVSGDGNEVLKSAKGEVYDWAFPLEKVIEWSVHYLGEKIDSSELYDKASVVQRFSENIKVEKPKRELELTPEEEVNKQAPPEDKKFTPRSAEELDSKVAGPDKRSSKLELDAEADKARDEEEKKKKDQKMDAWAKKESKKISSTFTDLIIERLQVKLNQSLKKKLKR